MIQRNSSEIPESIAIVTLLIVRVAVARIVKFARVEVSDGVIMWIVDTGIVTVQGYLRK